MPNAFDAKCTEISEVPIFFDSFSLFFITFSSYTLHPLIRVSVPRARLLVECSCCDFTARENGSLGRRIEDDPKGRRLWQTVHDSICVWNLDPVMTRYPMNSLRAMSYTPERIQFLGCGVRQILIHSVSRQKSCSTAFRVVRFTRLSNLESRFRTRFLPFGRSRRYTCTVLARNGSPWLCCRMEMTYRVKGCVQFEKY